MDIEALNYVEMSETGFEFEFLDVSNGNGTGLFITVIGEHAEQVQEWKRKTINSMRNRDFLLLKKGKDEYRKYEEDVSSSLDSAVARIIGFRGISENGKPAEFSKETARRLCSINPEILNQVLETSNMMSNFTLSK